MRKLTENDQLAIDAIEEFKKEIPKLTDSGKSSAWQNKVTGCLVKWIGGDIALVDLFHTKLTFSESAGYSVARVFSNKKEIQNKFIDTLSEVQNYIKIHGVIVEPEPEKVNWFFKLSGFWATTLATVCLGLIGWISLTVSRYFKDKDYMILENKYGKLRDSLFVVSSVQDSQIKDTATTEPQKNTDKDSTKHQ